MVEDALTKPGAVPVIVALSKWQQQVGVASVTLWRWRRRGWLKTLNIAGRAYLTKTDAETFLKRAQAGQFARVLRSSR